MRVIIDFYIHRCLWCDSIQSTTQVKKNQNCFCLFNPELYPYRIFLLVLVHPCSFIHSFFLKLVPFTGTNFIFVCNSRTVASSVTSPVEGIAKTICILNSGVCAGGRYSSPPPPPTHPPTWSCLLDIAGGIHALGYQATTRSLQSPHFDVPGKWPFVVRC